MPQTIDESILQGLQELDKARREAEGSPLLAYEYPEEAQKFGRRVAREAFEKHVLQPEMLTFEDLKASIGKGPCLNSNDIANTYYSDEEFLSALAARHGDTAAS